MLKNVRIRRIKRIYCDKTVYQKGQNDFRTGSGTNDFKRKVKTSLFRFPKSTVADLEISMQMCPEMPVGGCLSKFLQSWEKITVLQFLRWKFIKCAKILD